jgi:hypothetical protein
MSQPQNNSSEIFLGLMILLVMHCVSGGIIFLLGYIIGSILGGYTIFGVWIGGSLGFFLIQLLYVIPLVLRFKRQGKTARMKGVIIGAVITALLNGACFLSFYR